MRCRDVNTMKRLIVAFTSDALTHAIDSCLDLSIVARYHVSVGFDCPPYSQIERSIFDSRTKQTAGSLFTQTGIDLTRLDSELYKCQSLNRNHSETSTAFQNLSPNHLQSERVISRTLRGSQSQGPCHQVESLWGPLPRPDLSIR
jgi:hypothetical protein